jgi:hypothetical protein
MWRWAWWLGIALTVSGCGSARFRPQASHPQRISVGQVRPVHVEDAGEAGVPSAWHPGSQGEVTLETELEPGTKLLRAGKAAGSVPDQVGIGPHPKDCVRPQASLQIIDGAPRFQIEPPELGGRHTLTLNQGPSTAPIAIETERHGVRQCDHVALGWPHAWEREPFWYGDLRLSFVGIVPRFSVGGLRLLLARWMGPLRLGVEAGLANAVVCGEDVEDCPERFALPLGAEAIVSSNQGSALFLTGGGRFTTLLAQEVEGGSLDLRAFTLQATGEVLVGASRRNGHEQAPAGGVLGLGADAGPAIVLGHDDGLGLALGAHLSYAFAP